MRRSRGSEREREKKGKKGKRESRPRKGLRTKIANRVHGQNVRVIIQKRSSGKNSKSSGLERFRVESKVRKTERSHRY